MTSFQQRQKLRKDNFFIKYLAVSLHRKLKKNYVYGFDW